MGKRTYIAVLVAAVVALAASSAAFAGNGSTAGTYDKTGTKIQKTLGSKKKQTHAPGAKVKKVTTLPFTGFDLAFVVIGGVVLVATGVSLRRVTRKPTA